MNSSKEQADFAIGLDIGSNTFSCVLIQKSAHGYSVVQDASYPVRLSENLRAGQPLDQAALQRSLKLLEQIADDFGLERPIGRRAVATQVLRIASNPEAFARPAGAVIGVPVEVISGQQEAVLTVRGALLGLGLEGEALIIDVGGQSTELGRIEPQGLSTVSLPLGVVGLLERHAPGDRWTQSVEDALRADIRAVLKGETTFHRGGQLVAVAGTATTLAMLDAGLSHWDREQVHGHRMPITRLDQWLARMTTRSPAERTAHFGIEPQRADVFPVGLIMLQEMARLGRHRELIISANGLRVGAALSLWEKP